MKIISSYSLQPLFLTLVCWLSLTFACDVHSVKADEPVRFQFQKNDRILLLGNTLIERAQLYGYLETALTITHPELNLSFRNLGWSGDTVWAESRGIFEAPEKGYAKMLEQIKGINPTVILLGYGGNEAYAGAEGKEKFKTQYQKLLSDLKSVSSSPRFLFLSPIPHPQFGSPYPDSTSYNQHVESYSKIIQELATAEQAPFIDYRPKFLSGEIHRSQPGQFFERSMNLTNHGYQIWTKEFVRQTGLTPTDLSQEQIAKLAPLREAILHKNVLHFHQWRPQNITYLLLFRKHEQGNNAVEIDEFKKLVEQAEQKIHQMAKEQS